MPEVAESTVSKYEGKPSPWGEGAPQADEGWGKVPFPGFQEQKLLNSR